MQSTRIIFGTSIIILLLFSFPKSFGFRKDICSREIQPICQNQATNIYHRFDKHLNDNSIREVDVKRERLLQIRSLDNDRDLSTSRIKTARDRSVSREYYSRISPESINRERIGRFIRERSVDRKVGEIRKSRNINLREISTDRDIRNENSNDNSQFRFRDSRLSNNRNRIDPDRRVRLSARRQTIQLSGRIREFRGRENQSNERRFRQIRDRAIDNIRNNAEREQRNFDKTTRFRSVENIRKSPEHQQGERNSVNVIECESRFADRVTTIRNTRQLLPERKSRISERNSRCQPVERSRESRERVQEHERRNNERNFIQRNSRSRSIDNSARVGRERSNERELQSERTREFRERTQERERLLPERDSRVSEQRNDERNAIRHDIRSRSIDSNIRTTERTRVTREHTQERERLSPERDSRVSERRNEERNTIRHDIRSRSIDGNIRTTERTRVTRERTQERERLLPERDSRVSERRNDERNTIRHIRSRSIDSNIRTTERTRVFREFLQERERDARTSERHNNVRHFIRAAEIIGDRHQESRFSERRNNEINSIRSDRSFDSTIRAAETSIESRVRLSSDRDARISERRDNERNSIQEIRIRSTDGITRAAERIRESLDRLPSERDMLTTERRNNERNSVRHVIKTRSVDNIRQTNSNRVSDERTNERNVIKREIPIVSQNIRNRENRQRLSPERESRIRFLDNFRTTERTQQGHRHQIRIFDERNSINRESHLRSIIRERSALEIGNIPLITRSIENNIRFGDRSRLRRNIEIRSQSPYIQTSNRMNIREYRDQNTQERVSYQRFREIQSVARDSTVLGRFERRAVREQVPSKSRLNRSLRDNRLFERRTNERHEQNRQSRNVIESRDSIHNLDTREQHDHTIVGSRRIVQLPNRFVLNRGVERNIRFVRESQERRENVIRNLKEHLSQYMLSANSHKLLKRDTNLPNLVKSTDRLSRTLRKSERLSDTNRRINILSRDDIQRLGNNERISDRRLEESQINILSRKQKDGFQIITDQRSMSVFRLAYPTKVQDYNLENQNIWINVVKILLACLLLLQISRNKTADLKMFKSIRIPMFSQLFKEKVQ